MRMSYTKIPSQLQNAVIGFGGSLPGVGKTYTRKNWAEKLRALNYQVIETGSTNKASDLNKTIYSVAGWTDMEQTRKQKKFVRKTAELKVYTQRSAFIMIDEAWMLSQEDIETIKKQFPKCCILLFGDPNQFPPISDNSMLEKFDEMKKDVYDKYIYQIRKAIQKGTKRNTIYSVDKMYNLMVQYRVKTPELKRFLDNIKQGFASEIDALKFFQAHQFKEDEKYDFAICRTWENGVYSYGNYRFEEKEKKRTLINLLRYVKGVYVGQTSGYIKEGFSKNSIFRLDGKSFENDSQITDMSIFKDEKKMHLQGAVTCHSIQGATLNAGTKVIIDVDDAMSLIDTNLPVEKELYEDFARFLYIACSRVQSEDDLVFKCYDVEKLCKIMSQGIGLENDLKGEATSSEKLCRCKNPIEFLLSSEELGNRSSPAIKLPKSEKFELIQLLKDIWNRGPDSLKDKIYNEYYNSLSCGSPKFSIHDLMEITGKSQRYVIRHESGILTKIEELLKKLKNEQPKEPRIATVGKTIGELMEEERKEEEEKEKKRIELNLEIERLLENCTAIEKEWWNQSKKNETCIDMLRAFNKMRELGN
jgi:hypothetical protein